MKLEVLRADFAVVAVRDADNGKVYWRDGHWRQFIDFGKPGLPLNKAMEKELEKIIANYRRSK